MQTATMSRDFPENKFGLSYNRYKQILEDMGIVYLSDSSVDIGENIRIHGLDLEKKVLSAQI